MRVRFRFTALLFLIVFALFCAMSLLSKSSTARTVWPVYLAQIQRRYMPHVSPPLTATQPAFATSTPTSTRTSSPSASPTRSEITATPTGTATLVSGETGTPSATSSAVPSETATPSPTASSTGTATSSLTTTPTATWSVTLSSTSTAIHTATSSATSTPTPSHTPSLTPSPTATNSPAWVITGLVTNRGTPAAGVPLSLGVYGAEPDPQPIAAATSEPNGTYRFEVETGALEAGQTCGILFENEGQEGWLGLWRTDSFILAAGDPAIHGGDLDIADVVLLAPNSQDPLRFPVTFAWTPRDPSWTSGETYQVEIRSQAGNDFFLSDADLTGGQFVLEALPGNLVYHEPYSWTIWIWGQDGYGRPFSRGSVTFSP